MNQHTTLYYREGASDKVYQASIEPSGDGCLVRFAYGRRGATLQTGFKTPMPVPPEEAQRIFDKLVREKTSKGYVHGQDGTPQVTSEGEGRDSGIRCQLLNPVGEEEVPALLRDERWCLQEKFDGRRLMIRKIGDEVTGINRRGLVTSMPQPIAEAAAEIPFDYLIDGEAVGDVFHAFDLLELRGTDLRKQGYLSRMAGLIRWIGSGGAIRVVATAIGLEEKSTRFDELRKRNAEGAVFKAMDAPWLAGRPASGGTQLKRKFVESASFIVEAVNAKRSVALALVNEAGQRISAGNVTIPPNHAIPEAGSVVEVCYLYAFRESGSVYQPVYLGRRDDLTEDDCLTSQLKFKTAQAA